MARVGRLLLVCAVGFGQVASAAPAPGGIVVARYAEPGWRLTVRDDRFAGERHCMVRGSAGTMLYQPGAFGFRTRSRDTLAAVYRIDDRAPVHWRDHYPSLIAAGVAVDGPALDDPTEQIVWVPEGELAGARIVRVRAKEAAAVRVFRLGAAERIVAAARALGCRIVPGV